MFQLKIVCFKNRILQSIKSWYNTNINTNRWKFTLRWDGFKYVLSQFGYVHSSTCLTSFDLSCCFSFCVSFIFCLLLLSSQSSQLTVTSSWSLHGNSSSAVSDSNVSKPGSSTYILGSSQNVLLGSLMQNLEQKMWINYIFTVPNIISID